MGIFLPLSSPEPLHLIIYLASIELSYTEFDTIVSLIFPEMHNPPFSLKILFSIFPSFLILNSTSLTIFLYNTSGSLIS